MPRPTARVLQLLELLEASPRTRTAAELAERLDVDERTVRRYVEHLQELDIPVRTVRGRYGGVHLDAGSRMPPLMLTDEEALTVLLGLQAAASAPGLSAAPVVLEATASKVRRVLPARVRARVERATGPSPVGGQEREATARPRAESAAGAAASPLPLAELLLLLERAVRDRRPVRLDHVSARGRRTQREVHPHGVVLRGGHWYLSAADPASGEQRTFRLDRLDGARLATGRFDAADDVDSAQAPSPTELVDAALTDVPWQHEVVVRAQGTPEEVRRALPVPLVAIAPVLSSDDALGAHEDRRPWTRVVLRAQHLDWLPQALLALPGRFTVQDPPALRDLLHQQGQRMIDASTTPSAADLRP